MEPSPVVFLSKKELCYYKMIDNFYKKCPEDVIVKMINIIEGNDQISLRILDWFVTRHSKKGIALQKEDGEIFDVHLNYKAQLKSYKKRYFDPFRRNDKFTHAFTINGEKKYLITTIGQLHFFNWAIENKIIDYVVDNLQTITKDMNLSNKEDKKNKDLKKSKSSNSENTTNSKTSTFINIDNDSDSDDDELILKID